MAGSLFAQEIDSAKVPQAVRAKLWQIYPDAGNVTWGYDCYTESAIVNGKSIDKKLCFRAVLINNKRSVEMYFDSSAIWYRDQEIVHDLTKFKNIPKEAKNKVAQILPDAKNITWEYAGESDVSEYCAYEAYNEDTAIERHLYFDSVWNYLGADIDMYGRRNLIPVESIRAYIKKKFKHSIFESMEILKDSNNNTKTIIVELGLNGWRYNHCKLSFDNNGTLLQKPLKYTVYPGDF